MALSNFLAADAQSQAANYRTILYTGGTPYIEIYENTTLLATLSRPLNAATAGTLVVDNTGTPSATAVATGTANRYIQYKGNATASFEGQIPADLTLSNTSITTNDTVQYDAGDLPVINFNF